MDGDQRRNAGLFLPLRPPLVSSSSAVVLVVVRLILTVIACLLAWPVAPAVRGCGRGGRRVGAGRRQMRGDLRLPISAAHVNRDVIRSSVVPMDDAATTKRLKTF
jgi:hypothetical protein